MKPASIGEPLSEDTLLVFLSDAHIGGAEGTGIFESAAELIALLEETGRHDGPVELVLAGDFFDLLRMEDEVAGHDRIEETIARPEYHDLFSALGTFARTPGHRVTYVVGNHDGEVWWNSQIRGLLLEAGLVHEVALSFAARFVSAPDEVIYCEHGHQLDPSNRITDPGDPLDTPFGTHVVTELVRPIGSGAAVTESLDLRELNHVFPIDDIPEWIGGRIFYQFLSQAIRWILTPMLIAVIAVVALSALISDSDGGARALRGFLITVALDLALLVVAFGLLFLVSRRVAAQAISIMSTTSFGRLVRSKRYRVGDVIRGLLEKADAPPMGSNISSAAIAVWVSGHTHAPSISEFVRADGRRTVIANTGCWLRQLQPIDARLGAPKVFVPAFVQTHVRIRSDGGGLTVELWEHPRRIDTEVRWIDPFRIVPRHPKRGDRRMQWIERVAIAGRMPDQPPDSAGPRIIASYRIDQADELGQHPVPRQGR